MDDRLETTSQWYDVTIAGKQYHISSRHGEGHIRRVEQLLEDTWVETNERIEGKSPTALAFLTALNLADRLLMLETSQAHASTALNNRLEDLLRRLDHALTRGRAALQAE